MANGTELHQRLRGQSAWRRSPVENPDTLIVNISLADAERDWQFFSGFYQRLLKCNELSTLFWDMPPEVTLTFPKFLDFYKMGSGRYLAFINAAAAEFEGEFIGVISISSWTSLHKCFAGIWIEPKWRGPNSIEFGKQVLRYLHGTLQTSHVYALTPWNAAQQFCSKIGMQSLVEIPNYAHIEGQDRDAEMFYSEYESCHRGLIRHLEDRGYMPNSAIKLAAAVFTRNGNETPAVTARGE